MLKDILMGRFGNTREIANLASYLVSDYANFVTGLTFVIDAGRVLTKGV
ncbi:SDR family oxidoreductase [Oceanobacillus senegalensis]|nr:SDR family oxidoreductase [Oceanobacillus senegalensis]